MILRNCWSGYISKILKIIFLEIINILFETHYKVIEGQQNSKEIVFSYVLMFLFEIMVFFFLCFSQNLLKIEKSLVRRNNPELLKNVLKRNKKKTT